MRIYRIELRHFRGFGELTIAANEHVVIMGEPGSGRSDLIDALDRVFFPDYTRTRMPVEFDFFKKDTSSRAEIEVTLGQLGDELEQAFLDHLEVWDSTADALAPELNDIEDIDKEQYEFVLRLCYRARWDQNTESGEHWVDYPKQSDPAQDRFERVPRAERARLPFVLLNARSKPFDLSVRGSFRRLLETKAGPDFKEAVLALEQAINEQAATFSNATEITKVLDSVMEPLEAAMDTFPAPVGDVIRFLPEGGSISGLLRSLGVAIDLQDGNGPLPLFRHAATLTTALATAQALSRLDYIRSQAKAGMRAYQTPVE